MNKQSDSFADPWLRRGAAQRDDEPAGSASKAEEMDVEDDDANAKKGKSGRQGLGFVWVLWIRYL